MKTPLTLAAVILLLFATHAAAFDYITNTQTIAVSGAASTDFSDFSERWTGYDDVKLVYTFTGVTLSNVALRLTYPQRGTVFLDKQATVVGQVCTVAYDKTNNVPAGTYYAEWLNYESAITNIPSRVLARGKVKKEWSVYEEDTQSTWSNPVAGTALGPPTHTVANPTQWGFVVTTGDTVSGSFVGGTYTNATYYGDGAGLTNVAGGMTNAALNAAYVNVTGDTMTGALIIDDDLTVTGDVSITSTVEVPDHVDSNGDIWLAFTGTVDSPNSVITIGDEGEAGNYTRIILDDAAQTVTIDADSGLTVTGTVTATSFAGDGSSLTNLGVALNSSSVDLTSTGSTDLYTVSAGETAVVEAVTLYVTSFDTGGAAPVLSVGATGDADLLKANFTTSANSDGAMERVVVPAFVTGLDTVTVTVATGSTATTHVANISIDVSLLE